MESDIPGGSSWIKPWLTDHLQRLSEGNQKLKCYAVEMWEKYNHLGVKDP